MLSIVVAVSWVPLVLFPVPRAASLREHNTARYCSDAKRSCHAWVPMLSFTGGFWDVSTDMLF